LLSSKKVTSLAVEKGR